MHPGVLRVKLHGPALTADVIAEAMGGCGAAAGSEFHSSVMNAITLSWEDWRAVLAILREKTLPHMLTHADHVEQKVEQRGPDEHVVTLSRTDEVFLRSYNCARWQLGIPLPAEK